MTRIYNVISADAHIETPPDEWAARMPAHLREYAPRVAPNPNGEGDVILVEGMSPIPVGLTVTGGQKFQEFRQSGLSYSDGLPGTGGPDQRLREQDQDGTEAEILFSAVAAIALKGIKHGEAMRAIASSYNDWLSEYCTHAPDRLFGIAIMPTSGIDDVVAEARRVAKLPGIVGFNLLNFPNGGQRAAREDDRFWAVCEETGLCAVGHHNFGGEEGGKSAHSLQTAPGQQLMIDGNAKVDLAHFANMLAGHLPVPTLPILTILQIILSGAFHRFPNLRFHFAETGIGWLPYWLEQMDDRYQRHRFWCEVELQKMPSQYIRDHFTFSFQEDHVGIRNRDLIGIDNICWASDFPHSVGDWPYSREVRARMMRNVPDTERRKIEALNIACQLGIMSKDEKARQAALPRTEPVPMHVTPRWEKRMG